MAGEAVRCGSSPLARPAAAAAPLSARRNGEQPFVQKFRTMCLPTLPLALGFLFVYSDSSKALFGKKYINIPFLLVCAFCAFLRNCRKRILRTTF